MNPASESQQGEYVLITAVGGDRPGIVDDLSRLAYDLDLNIEDSRMALLGGEFAALMLVRGGSDCRQRLEDRKQDFERESGLALFIRPAQAPRAIPGQPALPYALSATALDHPGIVFRVTSLLRSHGINIVSAETRTSHAPFTGTPVFTLDMEMDIPAGVSVPRLRDELRGLGERENIDFELTSLR